MSTFKICIFGSFPCPTWVPKLIFNMHIIIVVLLYNCVSMLPGFR